MARTFQEAQKEVNDMYKNLKDIADDIIKKNTGQLDNTIKQIENNVENLTDNDLRNYMLKLASLAYALGDKVEHADFKRDCANALLKETNAREFNLAAGPVATKQNVALLNTSQETTVNILYNTVADSMKSKLQLTNRMLDSIKNVLISRSAEAKIQNQLGFGTKEEF